MAGLFHTLNVGEQSLYLTRQGVDTAGHNIANAQVEGYSRQRVNATARDPLLSHGNLIGNGAYIQSIKRAHDQWTENQVNRANQTGGYSKARFDALKSLEGVFSPELASGVGDELTNLFNSLQELANAPEDLTVRTNVREIAKNVVGTFQRVDEDLRRNQIDLNDKIGLECSDITNKLQSIAQLNVKIQESEATPGANANDLRDERDRLLRDITGKIDISYYEDQYGMVFIRGPRSTTLVDGRNASSIEAVTDSEHGGMKRIQVKDWEGTFARDVTDDTGAGSVSGMLEVRDNIINGLVTQNNAMAAGLVQEFNSIHRNGYGIHAFQEATGRNFFKPVDNFSTAAQEISLDDAIVDSTDAIAAASSPMAPGDNVVVNDLLRLKDAKIFNNASTLHDFYGNYVGSLATEVVRATHIKDADEIVGNDLRSHRDAVAGVSLDEEAMNLMRWQANFTASSKVITTVDEMLDTVLGMKR